MTGGTTDLVHPSFRCLIAMPDAETRTRFRKVLSEAGVLSIAEAENAGEMLDMTVREKPHCALVHLLLPGLDESHLVQALNRMGLYRVPAVVFVRPDLFPISDVSSIPASAGADDICIAISRAWPPMPDDALLRRADALLTNMGFPATPARRCLSYAVALAYLDSDRARKLSKEIYPEIAAAFGITERRASDAIYRLIDRVWMTGDIEKLYSFFGNTIDDMRGKPTVSAMIAVAAEILRLRKDDEAR